LSITGVFINNNARGFLRGSPTTGALLFVGMVYVLQSDFFGLEIGCESFVQSKTFVEG